MCHYFTRILDFDHLKSKISETQPSVLILGVSRCRERTMQTSFLAIKLFRWVLTLAWETSYTHSKTQWIFWNNAGWVEILSLCHLQRRKITRKNCQVWLYHQTSHNVGQWPIWFDCRFWDACIFTFCRLFIFSFKMVYLSITSFRSGFMVCWFNFVNL